jgi:hypothetical protein
MCNSLGICGDAIMLFSTQVNMSGSEAREYILNFLQATVGGSMLDDDLVVVSAIEVQSPWTYQRLAFGIDSRSMKGMARYDVYIFWQVLLERGHLGGFA